MAQITPEVTIETDVRNWLLRVDGAELAFVDDYEDGVRAVDSLVVEKIALFEKENGPRYKVYRQNLEDGRVVKIYAQSIGLWNGTPYCIKTVDLIPLKKVTQVTVRKVVPPPAEPAKVAAAEAGNPTPQVAVIASTEAPIVLTPAIAAVAGGGDAPAVAPVEVKTQ